MHQSWLFCGYHAAAPASVLQGLLQGGLGAASISGIVEMMQDPLGHAMLQQDCLGLPEIGRLPYFCKPSASSLRFCFEIGGVP